MRRSFLLARLFVVALAVFPEAAGSIYTRWGRRSCPTSSTLVYEGDVQQLVTSRRVFRAAIAVFMYVHVHCAEYCVHTLVIAFVLLN